jgi:hypothetical protein
MFLCRAAPPEYFAEYLLKKLPAIGIFFGAARLDVAVLPAFCTGRCTTTFPTGSTGSLAARTIFSITGG